MKSGIEYFPLDVYLEDNIKLIEAEFGLIGFGVVVKLWQKIYAGHGYYIEWTNEVTLLFSREIALSCNVVSEIVSASIRRGIFNEVLFNKFGILTSAGIQKRYFKICERRKDLEVKKDYLLINANNLSKNVNILSENVSIITKNVNISEQSKVKESKVKEKNISSEKFSSDSIQIKLANELKELILLNHAKAKVPSDLQKWAADIDEIIRIDKRTEEEIHKVIVFSQNDTFWKANILSPGNLRKKYDTLWLQCKGRKDQPQQFSKFSKPTNMQNSEQRKYDKSYYESLYDNV